MSAALAFAPLLAAQADEVGGEEIVVPTIVEEEVVVIQEAPVSLPPPGMTRETSENAQESEDEASSR